MFPTISQLVAVASLAFSCLPHVRSHTIAPRQEHNPVSLVYQFPPGNWVENVAVRPNGKILAIITTTPLLYEIDPQPEPVVTVVYNFSVAGNALQSIIEFDDDVFYIHVLTCTILLNSSCLEGNSSSVWGIDLNHKTPRVREVTKVPEGKLLNGVDVLNKEKGLIIFSDSTLGGFWTVNVNTGAYDLTIPDPAMSGNGSRGINGVQVRSGELWYVNSGTGIFKHLPVDLDTGEATGEAVIVTTGLKPDDLEVDLDPCPKSAYITNGIINEVVEVDLSSGSITRVFTSPEIQAFSGLTSARWGKAGGHGRPDFLYVSSNGGMQQYREGNVTNGGGVMRVDVR